MICLLGLDFFQTHTRIETDFYAHIQILKLTEQL